MKKVSIETCSQESRHFSWKRFELSKPNMVLTAMTPFETGVDESSGILLQNKDMEIVIISLTMRAKQPKRGLIACENGDVEVYNFPRADHATVTYTSD